MVGSGIQIEQAEALEVANKDVLGEFGVFQPGEVFGGLFVGFGEVLAPGLVFNKDGSFPEEVHKALFVVGLADAVLEGSNTAATDTEDVEEAIVEGFRFGILARFILPFFAESNGAGFDFVPGEGHGRRES